MNSGLCVLGVLLICSQQHSLSCFCHSFCQCSEESLAVPKQEEVSAGAAGCAGEH